MSCLFWLLYRLTSSQDWFAHCKAEKKAKADEAKAAKKEEERKQKAAEKAAKREAQKADKKRKKEEAQAAAAAEQAAEARAADNNGTEDNNTNTKRRMRNPAKDELDGNDPQVLHENVSRNACSVTYIELGQKFRLRRMSNTFDSPSMNTYQVQSMQRNSAFDQVEPTNIVNQESLFAAAILELEAQTVVVARLKTAHLRKILKLDPQSEQKGILQNWSKHIASAAWLRLSWQTDSR